MAPDAARLREVFDRVEALIERRWNIPVRIKDVPNPFTGDLDGHSIDIDFDLDVEDSLFILIHLFGHTVQWNVSDHARRIAFRPPAPSRFRRPPGTGEAWPSSRRSKPPGLRP